MSNQKSRIANEAMRHIGRDKAAECLRLLEHVSRNVIADKRERTAFFAAVKKGLRLLEWEHLSPAEQQRRQAEQQHARKEQQ